MASDPNADLANNRFYKIAQNISWFLIITIWFVLNFIPLLFFFLFVETTMANIVWYLVGSIPLGPAMGALITSTIRVVETDDFSEPRRDFFRYYRKNFGDSLKIWVPYLVLSYLAFVNINYYFNILEEGLVFGYIFVFLMVLLTLYLIPLFLIQMKFEFRYKDLLKLGMFYLITRFKITIGNLLVGFIILVLMVYVSEWLLFVIPAIVSYFIVLYNYRIIKHVKENFTDEEENEVV